MSAFVLFLLTAWAATAAGRILTARLVADSATSLERSLVGFAIGLGVLAYGMLATGLAGGLYPAASWLWLVGLTALGGRQHGAMAREIGRPNGRPKWTPRGWGIAFVFAAFAIVALIGDFAPPIRGLDAGIGYTEWDSIAYHLADPKLYVSAHRLYYLSWESHSNFAFTAEMWYTFALLIVKDGVPLAKLFHFACGVGTCLTIYAFGARHFSPRIGKLAALLFASTPLVFWEAGTAYVDLAATFFATLTLLALANAVALSLPAASPPHPPAPETPHPPAPSPSRGRGGEDTFFPNPLPREGEGGAQAPGEGASGDGDAKQSGEGAGRWPFFVSAVLMGLTLSCKATALTTLAILAAGLLVWQMRTLGVAKAVKTVAVWCIIALVVGAPWYVKSFVYTGNPVYPFFFGLFGGRFWNEAAAGAYNASNASFGGGRTALDFLLLPWNVTILPLIPQGPQTLKLSFNDFPTPLVTLSPVLLAALFFPAFFRRSAPPVIRALGLYALASLAVWFVTMQYVRYLLPLVPVLCLLAAWATARAWEEKWLAGKMLAGLTVASVAWGLWIGGNLAARQAPVVFGRVTRDEYIGRGYPGYPAMQFINKELPTNAKIVFYGHPFGFYCDRNYLWGEAGHSTYIPYQTMHSADDLRTWLTKNGVTHILIDSKNFALTPSGSDYTGWLYELTAGKSAPLFERRGIGIWAVGK